MTSSPHHRPSSVSPITATQAKAQMVAERYRKEQNFTRLAAIDACPNKNVAVECYAGQGHLTNIYKEHFKKVITNDINPASPAEFHMPTLKFLEEVIEPLNQKIDHIDFDCYGCPAFEVQKYFELRKDIDFPLTISISDGFGMWMKRNKSIEPIRKRFLLEGEINTKGIWNKHLELVDNLVFTLAEQNGAKIWTQGGNTRRLEGVQTKFKNYVLCSYYIE